MTQDEKDRLKAEAFQAYYDTYVGRGGRTSDMERYFVYKGIEAMAAICFERMERMVGS